VTSPYNLSRLFTGLYHLVLYLCNSKNHEYIAINLVTTYNFGEPGYHKILGRTLHLIQMAIIDNEICLYRNYVIRYHRSRYGMRDLKIKYTSPYHKTIKNLNPEEGHGRWPKRWYIKFRK